MKYCTGIADRMGFVQVDHEDESNVHRFLIDEGESEGEVLIVKDTPKIRDILDKLGE